MPKLKIPSIGKEAALRMLDVAEKAKANTYPEAGSYAVAILTDNGNIYEGIAYKSDTQTLTMHSEATALANAAIHGEKSIVAITGPNCHICKQLIWESAIRSGIDTQIVLRNGEAVELISISQLMPLPWPDEEGNK